jgi:hypothetical protein
LWKHVIEATYLLNGSYLWSPRGAWVLTPSMIWRNFYDIRTKQTITLTLTTSPDGHRFTKHGFISCTRHHCKASAIPSASATPDLTSLDWCVLIPATIQAQSDGMVVAVYNTLQPLEEELLAELRSFAMYVQALPLVSR